MKHIIGNIWHFTPTEIKNIMALMMAYEMKMLGTPLMVSNGARDIYWDTNRRKEIIDDMRRNKDKTSR